MEIILAVMAVIIIAAIAFIVWRSKQSPTTPQVLQPTLDNTTPVTPAPTTAATPTPQPNLDIAQALIDEQRYDEATAIIKKQLIANPKDAHAMFKLLQIYGLTENFAAFRQLHDKIRASGDTAIIAQADELSSLLQPTPAPAVVATPSTSPVADSLESGLDFSTENTQGATSDDGLDFFSDSAELNLSDTANETQASTQDSSLDLDNGDFSLDFDEPASSAQPSNTHGLTIDGQSHDEFADLAFDLPATDDNNDLTFDEPAADSTSVADELDALADFDFDDNSLDNLDEPVAESSLPTDSDDTLAGNDDLLSDDFDLTFDASDVVSTETETAVDDFVFEDLSDSNVSEATVADTNDDFDFAFDEALNTDTQDSVTIADDNVTNAAEQSTDFAELDTLSESAEESLVATDDFVFDLENDTLETAPNDTSAGIISTTETTTATDDISVDMPIDSPQALEDEFDFTLDENDVADTTQTITAPLADETAVDDFDFSFDDEAVTTPAATADTKPEEEFIFDPLEDGELDNTLDAKSVSEVAPVIDTPAPLLNDDVVFDDTATNTLSDTTSAGSVTTGNQMLSELDFVNGLDNVQITLDLASRYIELGEHDSAKRLLDEVLATGSQEQKQNAQTLLSRIA